MIGSNARPLASARRSSCAIAALHRRRAHARRLDDDVRRQRRARERLLHLVVRLDDARATSGTTRRPAARGAAAARAAASASSTPAATAADRAGRRRTRSTIAPQIRPSPSSRLSRPTNGTRSRSTLSPSRESSAGSTVSEPSTATATTRIVAKRERGERLVAGQEHAGHRRHHRQPGDQHRAAGGRRGGLERGVGAASGRPLLLFALQVEHRVVDADREPDQEHHRRCLERDREQVAGQRDQPERREDGGQREQQRDARRHERAEREHEDDQRDRERERAGLAEVVAVRGLDALLRAGVAELADCEARVGALRGGDRVEDRLDLVDCLVLVAADLEVDERGVSVLGDRAAPDVLHGRQLRDARRHVVDRCGEGRRRRPRAERLWIRTLSSRGLLEAGVEDLVHAARLARARRVGSMFFMPTRPPSPKATTTKASQPKVAVFQWAALQRPMRAARLEWCGLLDMLVAPFRSIAADATSAAGRQSSERKVGFGRGPGDDLGSYSGRRRHERACSTFSA